MTNKVYAVWYEQDHCYECSNDINLLEVFSSEVSAKWLVNNYKELLEKRGTDWYLLDYHISYGGHSNNPPELDLSYSELEVKP